MTDPMKTADWVIAGATLLGPILAVQAQKWLERGRERSGQRSRIFYVLMTTRANRLSRDHVQALNSIDLYFGERKATIFRWIQPSKDRDVTDAWKAYNDKLSERVDFTNKLVTDRWIDESHKLLIEMLFIMSKAIGYRFSKNQIERAIYSPKAHEDLEATQNQINSGLIEFLSGRSTVKMNVVGFPISQEALEAQIDLQKAMRGAVSPDGLRVVVGRSREIEPPADA